MIKGTLEKGDVSKCGFYATRHLCPLFISSISIAVVRKLISLAFSSNSVLFLNLLGKRMRLGWLIKPKPFFPPLIVLLGHQQPKLKYTKLILNHERGRLYKLQCSKWEQKETWSKLWAIRKQRVMVSKRWGKIEAFFFFNQLTATVTAGWTFKHRFELKQGGSSLAFHRNPDSSEISFHSSLFQFIMVVQPAS